MTHRLTRKHAAILLAIIAGGLALRMIGSDRSIWGDEPFSLYWAQRGLRFLWTDGFTLETNPPLYYTIILGWTKLFGTSEISLRMPGILASVATIALICLIGTRLFKPSVGLIAAGFFALTPLQISLSDYARSYALQGFFAGLCFYGMVLFFTIGERRKKAAALYIVGAIALAYTHYTQAFLLAAFGITGALFCRKDRRLLLHWLGLNLTVFVATLLEISCMLIIYHNAPMSLLKIPMNFVPGNIELFLAGVEYSSSAAVLCALIGFAVYSAWKSCTPLARMVLIVTPGLFIAILTIGNFWLVIFHEKSLIVLSIPVSILLAAMVDRIEDKSRFIALGAIVALYAASFPRGEEVTPYRAMFATMPHPDQNTYLVFGPHDQIASIGYYRPDIAHDRIYRWDANNLFPIYLDTALWLKLFSVHPMETLELEQLIKTRKHVYLVTNTAVFKMYQSQFPRAPDHVIGDNLVRLYEWQGAPE